MNKILISDYAHIVIADSANQALAPLVEALNEKYHVHAFQGISACLAYLETNSPADLVLVDGAVLATGSDLAINLLQTFVRQTDVPMVVGVDVNDSQQHHWMQSFDVFDYLIKPYSIAIELFRIEKHVRQHRSLQIIREQNQYLSNKIDEHARNLINASLEAQNIADLETEILVLLGRLADYRDPQTAGHLNRMSHYAKLIAKNLGLSQEQQNIIQQAAPLHDIGKLAVPDKILFKPGQLTGEEKEEMQLHAQKGYELLKDSASPLILVAADMALSHHEKFDGSGYPNNLSGQDIPLLSRIVAVADVFDALTSRRSYKSPWPLEEAADYLRGQSGKHFDPRCVDAFLVAWPQVLAIHTLYGQDSDDGH